MSMSDPIADMLTRIRNANSAKKEYADVPSSNLKKDILKIMKDEGFIQDYKMAEESGHPWLRIFLKFSPEGEGAIRGIRRVSLSGRRIYVGSEGIPRVLGGLGVSILSTSKGLMTGHRASKLKLGGEVLCKVW
jgi:small subunit ribosomal protein S8